MTKTCAFTKYLPVGSSGSWLVKTDQNSWWHHLAPHAELVHTKSITLVWRWYNTFWWKSNKQSGKEGFESKSKWQTGSWAKNGNKSL